jgi:hypothetical protein
VSAVCFRSVQSKTLRFISDQINGKGRKEQCLEGGGGEEDEISDTSIQHAKKQIMLGFL